jgi:signal transduction histidine kinase
MRRTLFLVTTTLFLAVSALAQAGAMAQAGALAQGNKDSATNRKDSSAILEARAAFRIIDRAPDSAIAISEKELTQAQNSGNKRLAAFAYKTRGWARMRKGAYDKTFPDLLLSERLFRELADTREEMYMDINLGIAYSNHSEFTNSARYLFIGDSLAHQLNDRKAQGVANRQMGILYREQGQYRKSIPYFREGMQLFRALRDTLNYFDAATSLAIVYIYMSMPDSSLAICDSCAPLINAMQRVHYEKGILNERYGEAWYGLKKYDKALASYGRAYAIFSGDNDQADRAYEAMYLGKTLTRMNRYREAENYLLLSYRLNDSLKMNNYTPDAALQLANLYKATGDWRKAYSWLEKRVDLMDSLQLATQNERTAQLQAQYEAEKKEKEIALLRKDQQLSLATVARQKTIRNAAIALALLLILIGILIINRNSIVHKSKRLIELEKMRNTIARDLHDDMGSALSSINIISKVALATTREGEKANEHLRSIYQHSGSILENMSDIVWTINPVNDTLQKIIFKMKEFSADIFDPLNIDHSFEEKGDLASVKLGLQTRRDLYLVFKEAVNNAAKYSQCTKVHISITRTDGLISIQVKDNGIGFCRETVRTGNGLRNMEQRAAQINGELNIAGDPGSGTTVTLRVRSHD